VIRAELITKWERVNGGLIPTVPTGMEFSDSTETERPIEGQTVIVLVKCQDLRNVNGYVVIWNEEIADVVV